MAAWSDTILVVAVLSLACSSPHAAIVMSQNSTSISITQGDSVAVFSKINGAILDASDTHQSLTQSRSQCLWGYLSTNGTYTGGCADGYKLTWQIDAAVNSISFVYTPSSDELQQHILEPYVTLEDLANIADCRMQVNITISAFSFSSTTLGLKVDMMISSAPCGSHLGDQLLWPSDLVLPNGTDKVFFPVLPGIELNNDVFHHGRQPPHGLECPGKGCMTDATSWTVGSARFAMVSSSRTDPRMVDPSTLNLVSYTSDDWVMHRVLLSSLDSPDLPYHAPRLTMMIGKFDLAQVAAYARSVRNIAAAPSLAEKLEDKLSAFASAPLMKMDSQETGLPFSQYNNLIQEYVNRPALIHLAAYEPVGFDRYYPDMLPPNPSFGTTADMQAMVAQMQQNGHLFVPYTNPTWWDQQSPTVQTWLKQGAALSDFTALDVNEQPIVETYGPNSGVVVEPNNARVQERVAQLVASMTHNVTSDAIFQDQIGARPWLPDYHPNVQDYLSSWINYTMAASSAGAVLMTEQGFDNLVYGETSFCGSALQDKMEGQYQRVYGTELIDAYPFAAMLMRDKVILQQHNLAPSSFVTNLQALSFNLAMGYSLSYELNFIKNSAFAPWYRPTSVIQQRFIAHYIDELAASFEVLQRNATSNSLTRTNFTSASIVRAIGSSNHSGVFGPLAPNGFEALLHNNGTDVLVGAYQSAQSVESLLETAASCGPEQILLIESSAGVSFKDVYYLYGCDADVAISTPCKTLTNATITTFNVKRRNMDTYVARLDPTASKVIVNATSRNPQDPVSDTDIDFYRVAWQCA
eukprot:TRINITY_DN11719_c0_g1_i10.p1 TRINITY_DN11719_c0_g1~~TRINITY_DN11719_c0_g1_i10.p1  ORF type:complete len:806 (+),score=178.11 TRINITY_DN11719_c0_g1_i10:2039-4456(+)